MSLVKGTSRPGGSADGAFCWVRFLWSLTFDVVVYAGKLRGRWARVPFEMIFL
jgi:hypothetical protein